MPRKRVGYGNMLPDEVVLLIRDFVPIHPAAKLIQELPANACQALHARYAAACACCFLHGNVAVNRMAWGFDLELPACDLVQSKRCVNKMFDAAFKGVFPLHRENLQVVARRLRGEWWGLDPADYDSD